MKNADWLAARPAELDWSFESTLTDSRPSLGRGVPRSAIEGALEQVNECFCARPRDKKERRAKPAWKFLGCSRW